jgi:hypothetical protein
MKTDSDLDTLRGRADFKDQLSKMQAKYGKPHK